MTTCHATAIAYDRAGPAGTRPVVLLHAGVADRRMWDPQWARLTADHDTVRLDLRGFGESATPPAGPWAPYRDVVDTLDALGVRAAHVVGCSFGAGVAAEVALERPDLVSTLVLVSPGGALIPAATDELRRFATAEGDALERGDLEAAVEANLAWWVDGPAGTDTRVDAAVREAVRTMQRRAFEVAAGWDDGDELEPEPALERLAEIAVPTLVLSGGLDLDAIHAAAALLVDGVPQAVSETWPDTAHLPSMERPEDFTTLITDWWASPVR